MGRSRDIRECIYVRAYIQKEMHRLHTETTRGSDYLLKTVLLLYMLRPDAARVAGYYHTFKRRCTDCTRRLRVVRTIC